MPFAGFLFDAYCSYDSGFLLMGAMIALSGAMLYPIPCIRNALSEVRMGGKNYCWAMRVMPWTLLTCYALSHDEAFS